jgi:aerobic-type carbon monoxide dehydrogenase small subunit (CoxS/CutS family)
MPQGSPYADIAAAAGYLNTAVAALGEAARHVESAMNKVIVRDAAYAQLRAALDDAQAELAKLRASGPCHGEGRNGE